MIGWIGVGLVFLCFIKAICLLCRGIWWCLEWYSQHLANKKWEAEKKRRIAAGESIPAWQRFLYDKESRKGHKALAGIVNGICKLKRR